MIKIIPMKDAELAAVEGALVGHEDIVQPIRHFCLYQEAHGFADEMLLLASQRDEVTDDKEIYEAYQAAHHAATQVLDAVIDAYVRFTTARVLGAIEHRKRAKAGPEKKD